MVQNFTLEDTGILTLPILPSPYTKNTQPIEAAPETLKARGVAIGHTHVFSPQWVNELRLGYTRERVYFANPLQGDNVAQKVGIPFVNNPAVAYSSGLSSFSVTGFTPRLCTQPTLGRVCNGDGMLAADPQSLLIFS